MNINKYLKVLYICLKTLLYNFKSVGIYLTQIRFEIIHTEAKNKRQFTINTHFLGFYVNKCANLTI